MPKSAQIKNFLRFYWEAKTMYNVHSPFLYDFLSTTFDLSKSYYEFYNIELIRSQLIKNNKVLNIKDLGAGSTKQKQNRTISDLAKSSTSNEDKCKLLHNICLYFQPKNILELGTNLGIASCYLHVACKGATMHTVEGDKGISEIAYSGFNTLGYKDINLFNLPFEKYLRKAESFVEHVDLAYIDGNHRGDATIRYFNEIADNQVQKKCIILDDIYWSEDMYEAWQRIKSTIKNGYTIDFYKMAVVVLDPSFTDVKHVKYIPWKYKPFSLGVFG